MEEKKGLTGSALKMIAMAAMLIDHIGASILENGVLVKAGSRRVYSADVAALHAYNRWLFVDRILRFTGRLAFPIFCFLLVEGFLHTRDWRKYFARLFVFSLISEIPFDLAFFNKGLFYWKYQNVFFTLAIGVLAMAGMKFLEELEDKEELARTPRIISQILAVLAGMALAEFLHTDYGGFGVCAIALLYYWRGNKKMQTIGGCVLFSWEVTAPLAFLPIYHYNGKRGSNLKYVFYAFYPAHLLILGLITKFCF